MISAAVREKIEQISGNYPFTRDLLYKLHRFGRERVIDAVVGIDPKDLWRMYCKQWMSP